MYISDAFLGSSFDAMPRLVLDPLRIFKDVANLLG